MSEGSVRRPTPYMPQLDALRCFAAVLVVWQHTRGDRVPVFGRAGVGVYGVWFFFVLSGFLITGILLREAGPDAPPLGATLRAFYARRFLRIFPAYYLVLAVGIAFGIGVSFRADWAWHLTYLSNWMMAWRGHWAGAASPLWSLGVEEQFYLVWPALVLLAPRRRLPLVFVAVASLGVVSRAVIVLGHIHGAASATVVTPTTSNLDPLAFGALLAWAHDRDVARASIRRVTAWGLALGLALFAFVALSSVHIIDRGWSLVPIVETLSAALMSVWIVDRAATGVRSGSLAGYVLDSRPLRYLGSISYGIYLWHHPLNTVIRAHLSSGARTFFSTPGGRLAYFGVVLTITVVVASLSWFLYERPINALKRRVPYPSRGEERTATTPVAVVDAALAGA